ncbi:MAG: hypothetical protein C4583_13615 [Anaerolineaceae bacterium]|nr:MAG: hypothetical protein C4583_13615 [Anaerolineaceae bacterium]
MKKFILPLALILLSLLLAFSLLNLDHEWGDDWASYLMQAISITKGDTQEFIQRNTFTMRESTHFIGPDAYPWGFPALLAPFTFACGPLNIFCLKTINLIFWALFLLVFYLLLARRLSPIEAALVLAVFAFSPLLLNFNNQLTSDIAFLFFSTLGLLLIVGRNGTSYPKGIPPYILGLALFFAFFVRTNGILLVPTLFLAQVFDYLQARPRILPDWKRILTSDLIPYYVFGLLTFLNLILFPAGEGSHFEHLSLISLDSLADNVSAYVALPAYFFSDLPYPEIIYGFLLPFILGGIVLNFKKDFPLIAYLGLSYALFILWPDQQGIRFLFPLLPLFVYFAYQGMTATFFALTSQFPRAGVWLTRGFWLVIIASFAWTSLTSARDNLAQGRGPYGNVFDPISIEMFEFIQSETPADSVVAFYKPRALRLFTDRNSLLVDDCGALPKANYVVLRKSRGAVDQISPDDIETCNPSVLATRVFLNDKFLIYEITPK